MRTKGKSSDPGCGRRVTHQSCRMVDAKVYSRRKRKAKVTYEPSSGVWYTGNAHILQKGVRKGLLTDEVDCSGKVKVAILGVVDG